MNKKIISGIVISVSLLACNHEDRVFDASGTFEADEVIVSSELGGKILSLKIKEGDHIPQDSVVATLDALPVALQKEQVEAGIVALGQKTADVNPQIRLLQDQLIVQQSQLENLDHEKKRIENLLKLDAATGKQLDDIDAQIDVVKKQMGVTRQQMAVQKNSIATQNRGILSESGPMQKRVAQLNDQIKRANIVNPVSGTILTKYALEGEVVGAGKALYKIADLSFITLRAYITGIQLSQVKLGQPVKVLVDNGADAYKEYEGTITWISDKAEFTPKTIQTKEERANLVYAIKINVKNDGYLKIGMYGEVRFNTTAKDEGSGKKK